MKLLIISTLLLLLIICYSQAQQQRCHGRIWIARCGPGADRGRGGRGCPPPVNVWYYDPSRRSCHPMTYLGCGGNDNRWCSRRDCELRCRW